MPWGVPRRANLASLASKSAFVSAMLPVLGAKLVFLDGRLAILDAKLAVQNELLCASVCASVARWIFRRFFDDFGSSHGSSKVGFVLVFPMRNLLRLRCKSSASAQRKLSKNLPFQLEKRGPGQPERTKNLPGRPSSSGKNAKGHAQLCDFFKGRSNEPAGARKGRAAGRVRAPVSRSPRRLVKDSR